MFERSAHQVQKILSSALNSSTSGAQSLTTSQNLLFPMGCREPEFMDHFRHTYSALEPKGFTDMVDFLHLCRKISTVPKNSEDTRDDFLMFMSE